MESLLNIPKSKLRKKLFTYFFTNPSSSLYLREIASLIKVDAGNLSKELNSLEREGIFASNHRGNQKYFSLNKRYPLYKELKSVIFKTSGVRGSLKRIIDLTEGIVLSFIYGSFAKGEENAASDIDIFIVGEPDEDALIKRIEDLEKKLQREINYTIYPKKEFKERLLKKDSFIVNIIKRPKLILKGSLRGI